MERLELGSPCLVRRRGRPLFRGDGRVGRRHRDGHRTIEGTHRPALALYPNDRHADAHVSAGRYANCDPNTAADSHSDHYPDPGSKASDVASAHQQPLPRNRDRESESLWDPDDAGGLTDRGDPAADDQPWGSAHQHARAGADHHVDSKAAVGGQPHRDGAASGQPYGDHNAAASGRHAANGSAAGRHSGPAPALGPTPGLT